MSKDNPISTAVTWYKKHGPNPLITSLLLGGTTAGLGALAWNPMVETFRSIGRPFTRGVYQDNPGQWDMDVDRIKKNKKARMLFPLIAGLITGGTALGLFYRPDRYRGGLFDWGLEFKDSPKPEDDMPKAASLGDPYELSTGTSYMNGIDWTKPVNLNTAINLFNNDPFLKDDPYARHMGTAIVTNAGIQQHTRKPTLGGIFDSAVNKIENKLSFGGITEVGVKTAVANGAARLFTGALDAVVGLPPSMQKRLVDAGTWAGAVSAILD